jgi:hypothetical protein
MAASEHSQIDRAADPSDVRSLVVFVLQSLEHHTNVHRLLGMKDARLIVAEAAKHWAEEVLAEH